MNGLNGAQLPRVDWDYFSTIRIPFPPQSIQFEIVTQIEKERQLVDSNKQFIQIYEQKIKDKIAEVWET